MYIPIYISYCTLTWPYIFTELVAMNFGFIVFVLSFTFFLSCSPLLKVAFKFFAHFKLIAAKRNYFSKLQIKHLPELSIVISSPLWKLLRNWDPFESVVLLPFKHFANLVCSPGLVNSL